MYGKLDFKIFPLIKYLHLFLWIIDFHMLFATEKVKLAQYLWILAIEFAEICESIFALLPNFGFAVFHENIFVAKVLLRIYRQILEYPNVTFSPLHGCEIIPTAKLFDISNNSERLTHARLKLNPESKLVGWVIIFDMIWIKKGLDCDAVGDIITNLFVTMVLGFETLYLFLVRIRIMISSRLWRLFFPNVRIPLLHQMTLSSVERANFGHHAEFRLKVLKEIHVHLLILHVWFNLCPISFILSWCPICFWKALCSHLDVLINFFLLNTVHLALPRTHTGSKWLNLSLVKKAFGILPARTNFRFRILLISGHTFLAHWL